MVDDSGGADRRTGGERSSRVPRPRVGDVAGKPAVAIIGRSRVFVEAIGSALTRTGAATVVTSSIDLAAGLQVIAAAPEPPGVVLLHAALPEGAQAIGDVREVAGCCGVVVLGLDHRHDDAVAWAEAGALGMLDLDAGIHDLTAAIRAVAEGTAFCSPSVTVALLARLTSAPSPRGAAPRGSLTPREAEIAALMAEGLSNKEIARRLCIQVATVKNHVHNVLTKLDMSTRAQTRI